MTNDDVAFILTRISALGPDVLRAAIFTGLLALLVVALRVFRERARRDQLTSRAARRQGTVTRRRARSRPAVATGSIETEEFAATIGEPPSSYHIRGLVIAAGAAIAALVVSGGSWALSILALIGIPYWRAGRARNRIQEARDNSFSTELLPFARQLEAHLAGGVPLAAALTELTRSARPTPLQRAFRRAMSEPAGLTEGLRAEEERSPVMVVREFFEILAEGSTASQRPAVVAETLHAFIVASTRRQAAWRAALRASIDARNNRTTVLVIAPAMLGINIVSTGGDAILHTTLGNVLVLIIGALLAMAFVMTEIVLRRLTRGL